MEKIDYKKELKHLYRAPAKKIVVVDVPAMNFLMIDGRGDPNKVPEYQEAVQALFTVSYTVKFMLKKSGIADYGVMPLEGLWWVDDMNRFSTEEKDEWQWRAMIMQPPLVTAAHIAEAIEQAEKKKVLPALPKMVFSPFKEGVAAQTLHIGPFSEEGPVIKSLHEFITEKGKRPRGKHHEIYLSDITRARPEKWKTIIRQPVTG